MYVVIDVIYMYMCVYVYLHLTNYNLCHCVEAWVRFSVEDFCARDLRLSGCPGYPEAPKPLNLAIIIP